MNKKFLMKIRLRPDGQWEHVYADGSTDQEFHQLTRHELAHLHKMQREELALCAENYFELAVEASEFRDAKEVLKQIMSK